MENVPGTVKIVCVYMCVGLLAHPVVIATTDTSETAQDQSKDPLNLEKRDADPFPRTYADLEKVVDDEHSGTFDSEHVDGEPAYFVYPSEEGYDELENESDFLDNDPEVDGYDTETGSPLEKRYRYYGFESQLGKRGRGPMGFIGQLGKRNLGYFPGQYPTSFIGQPGRRRGPMGFFSQLGKRRVPMGFMSQLGKRAPMGFMGQLGKRAPMGFMSQLGKRAPMGFMSQLGKRAPMGFMSQLGKRAPMGFMSQLGKRETSMDFLSETDKRAPMGFMSQLGKRRGPMGFYGQLGKRSDNGDTSLVSEADEISNQPLSRRKRSARAVPWEASF